MQDPFGLLTRYRQSTFPANKVEIAGFLVEAIAPKLWLFLFARVPTPDIEDVRQEVLMAVALGLDSCQATRSGEFWSWVYSIARHKIANRYGNKVQWVPLEPEEMRRLIEASEVVEGMTRQEKGLVEELVLALEKLPEYQRFCVWSHAVEDQTFVAIGAMSGKSASAARMAFNRGTAELKRLLTEKVLT